MPQHCTFRGEQTLKLGLHAEIGAGEPWNRKNLMNIIGIKLRNLSPCNIFCKLSRNKLYYFTEPVLPCLMPRIASKSCKVNAFSAVFRTFQKAPKKYTFLSLKVSRPGMDRHTEWSPDPGQCTLDRSRIAKMKTDRPDGAGADPVPYGRQHGCIHPRTDESSYCHTGALKRAVQDTHLQADCCGSAPAVCICGTLAAEALLRICEIGAFPDRL